MTTLDHVERIRKLKASPLVCECRTCGAVTQIVRGNLVSRGWSREDAARVTTAPPMDASYPYLASVRVDDKEVYRVHADLAEATDQEVMADVEAALRRPR
jgi:hypothetical protein